MSHQPEIIMYSRQRFCPDVARVRTRLSDLGIAWTEFDIETDDAAKARTIDLTGRTSVPTLVIGDSILVEPSTAELDAALFAVGYDVDDE